MKDPQVFQPDPSPLDSTLRGEKDIARHRRLYCPHYDRCLNHSILQGWQSFSCTRCPLSGDAPDHHATPFG